MYGLKTQLQATKLYLVSTNSEKVFMFVFLFFVVVLFLCFLNWIGSLSRLIPLKALQIDWEIWAHEKHCISSVL